MTGPNELLQGTVDLMILKAVSLGPMHGWGISQRIQQITRGVLEVNQGALYPALHRLEDQGWLDAEWGTSDNNRRAKFYQLTTAGRKQLTVETRTWQLRCAGLGANSSSARSEALPNADTTRQGCPPADAVVRGRCPGFSVDDPGQLPRRARRQSAFVDAGACRRSRTPRPRSDFGVGVRV